MAAKDRIGKASDAARAAQRNRYVKRLIEDEDLRRNLIAAYGAARSAYSRLGSNGKPASRAIFEDKKLQRELSEAAQALRDASGSFTEQPKRRRKGGFGRLVLLSVLGGTLAIVFSESLRSKLLDMLFGAEEEFDYSSTTAPSQPAPAAPVQDASSTPSS
jgi:hypothetical protein